MTTLYEFNTLSSNNSHIMQKACSVDILEATTSTINHI